jgi:hypothetical protein
MKVSASFDANGQVYLYLDQEGRDFLVCELQSLEYPSAKSHEHFHLFSQEWGPGDLDTLDPETLENTQQQQVHHMKVFMRPSEKDVWKDNQNDD